MNILTNVFGLVRGFVNDYRSDRAALQNFQREQARIAEQMKTGWRPPMTMRGDSWEAIRAASEAQGWRRWDSDGARTTEPAGPMERSLARPGRWL